MDFENCYTVTVLISLQNYILLKSTTMTLTRLSRANFWRWSAQPGARHTWSFSGTRTDTRLRRSWHRGTHGRQRYQTRSRGCNSPSSILITLHRLMQVIRHFHQSCSQPPLMFLKCSLCRYSLLLAQRQSKWSSISHHSPVKLHILLVLHTVTVQPFLWKS